MKFPHPILFLLFSHIFIHQPILAAETLILTENQIPARVRAQNPSLAAARLRIDDATARMMYAGRLDNPTLQITPRFNASSKENGIELNLSQKFPLTQRLGIEKKLTVLELEAAKLEIKSAENQLIGEAHTTAIQLLALQQRRALLQQQKEAASAFADSLEIASKKGEASPLDALQAKLTAPRCDIEISILNAQEQQHYASIKQLLGMNINQKLVIAGALESTSKSSTKVISKHPELAVAEWKELGAKQNLSLELAKKTSDVSMGLVAGYERNLDEPLGMQNEGIIGFQFSIPLPLWNRNEAHIQSAAATSTRRQLETKALQSKISLEAEAIQAEMTEWKKLLQQIDDTLIPQIATQTRLTEEAWQKGQVKLADLVRCREQAYTIAMARLDALQNYQLARVRFNTALGIN